MNEYYFFHKENPKDGFFSEELYDLPSLDLRIVAYDCSNGPLPKPMPGLRPHFPTREELRANTYVLRRFTGIAWDLVHDKNSGEKRFVHTFPDRSA